MKHRSYAAGLSALAVLALLMLARPARAESFEFDPDPAVAVLRYTRVHGLIRDQAGPSMVLYGDGRVQVLVPSYMHRSGEREIRLSRDEMIQLLDEVTSGGLLDIDTGALRSDTRHAALEEQAGITRTDGVRQIGTVHATSDAVVTVIEINGRRRDAADARPVRKTLRWANLKSDADRFKNVAALQELADVESRLTGIMERANAKGASR